MLMPPARGRTRLLAGVGSELDRRRTRCSTTSVGMPSISLGMRSLSGSSPRGTLALDVDHDRLPAGGRPVRPLLADVDPHHAGPGDAARPPRCASSYGSARGCTGRVWGPAQSCRASPQPVGCSSGAGEVRPDTSARKEHSQRCIWLPRGCSSSSTPSSGVARGCSRGQVVTSGLLRGSGERRRSSLSGLSGSSYCVRGGRPTRPACEGSMMSDDLVGAGGHRAPQPGRGARRPGGPRGGRLPRRRPRAARRPGRR